MGRFVDITGTRYGRLTVKERTGTSVHNAALWLCHCDCGNEIMVTSNNLRTGHTKSCGCTRREKTSEWLRQNSYKHGGSSSRLYKVWSGMKARTENPNNSHYKYYGALGIKVCDEWRDFLAFRSWAVKSGYDEKAEYGKCTIDRIDVNKGYSPDNCRWVDLATQANNKRKAVSHGTEICQNERSHRALR